MTKKEKEISLKFFSIMAFMFSLIIIILVVSNKNITEMVVKDKATLVAQSVQDGLTAHMVNGIMDKRETFLKLIEELDGVEKLWIIRGDKVSKQYGPGQIDEQPKDDIDKMVLSTGKVKTIFNDSLISHSSYRITIPYIAKKSGTINCLSCHNEGVKEGDTLGAISLVIDVDPMKIQNIDSLKYIIAISVTLIIITLILINRIIKPYLGIFDEIKEVMDKAQKGDYSSQITEKGDSENKAVAQRMNALLRKLESSISNINQNVKVFIDKNVDKDPLEDIKYVIEELTNVYKFRKTIEHDEKLMQVYDRLSYVLEHHFKFKNFLFVECDTTNKKSKIVYQFGKYTCRANEGCRADRTNTLVDSCQFNALCDKFPYENKYYLCIPYSISNDLDFIISLIFESEEELKKARDLIPDITNYIEAAKPEIVSKKLMETLEMNAKTDPLTGLYNRKYLEEYIEFILKQRSRNKISYGILMCDIDYFKKINDTYGHDVGDRAIKTIAETLVENTRESDVVVRYGGEEFIVILYNCDEKYIIEVAEKIRISFSKKKIDAGGGESFSKTISIGAAVFPNQADSFWKAIKYADLALYYAKNNGRNQVKLFDKALLEQGEEY